jgi:hypothetical protein
VLEVIGSKLCDIGFEVVDHYTGQTALDDVFSSPKPFDLLIVDVRMLDELAARIGST